MTGDTMTEGPGGIRNAQAAGAGRESAADVEEVHRQLEALRHKLLDLSARNKLLNYGHPAKSCLRVVDELPEQLFERLKSGKSFVFDSVPEPKPPELERYYAERGRLFDEGGDGAQGQQKPEARHWAEWLGIETGYELPTDEPPDARSRRHQDLKIQTLHYRDALDARLRKMRADARTAIEESGVNMLYLAFGFLEWFDARRSDQKKAYLAPLVLMPVEIERRKSAGKGGAITYRLSWTGEDVQFNLSLAKKLETDFDLALPEIGDEEGAEAYFERVKRAVNRYPDWHVRRYITLAFFNFGKLLLYTDLQPENWPRRHALEDHAVIRSVLLRRHDESSIPSFEMPPDEEAHDTDIKLELVDRADSSQARALRAALAGNRLTVIQGPPGTGKSQTITNLMAVALNRGLKVLFVSEKLAALEVVRKRMHGLGLGDFCLELHSHKTRKRALLEDLARRLRKQNSFRAPRGLESKLRSLSSKRAQLDAYAKLIGSDAGVEGMTVGEVLTRTAHLRMLLGELAETLDALSGDPDGKSIPDGNFESARDQLRLFGEALQRVQADGPVREHPWAGISGGRLLPNDEVRISSLLQAWKSSAEALQSTLEDLAADLGAERETVESAKSGFAGLAESLTRLKRLRRRFDVAEQEANAILKLAGRGPSQNLADWRFAAWCRSACEGVPAADLDLWIPALSRDDAGPVLETLEDLQRKVVGYHRGLSNKMAVRSATQEDVERLRAAARELRAGGLFSIFDRRNRDANRLYREFALARSGGNRRKRALMLDRLASYLETVAELDQHAEGTELLGSAFAGRKTDVGALKRLSDWARTARDGLIRSGCSEAHAAEILSLDSASLRGIAEAENPEMQAILEVVSKPGQPKGNESKPVWQAIVDLHLDEPFRVAAYQCSRNGDFDRLIEAARRAEEACATEQAAWEQFVQATDLAVELWFGGENGAASLNGRLARAARALACPNLFGDWLDYDRIRRRTAQPFMAELMQLAECGTVNADQLVPAHEFMILSAASKRLLRAHPELVELSGLELEALRRTYCELDEEVMELRRAAAARSAAGRKVPQGRNGTRVADLTQMYLINRELQKQRNHLPIRRLVERAGEALVSLKPCLMMGPLSVAQYMPRRHDIFDLVVIDEASQMRTEDALGVLARGKAAVIVGDSKQLPPTNFFDRVIDGGDGDDDDDNAIAPDTESILELAESSLPSSVLERGIPRLRWHYRSRHESLIAFSNTQFYENDLIVMPSPHLAGGRYGIEFHYLEDGVCRNRINAAEAIRVAEAAVAHLRAHPARSLGVAAMNIQQKERIEAEVERLMQDDAEALLHAQSYEERLEPFFVKNLENVQGDERDVIMLSMTYGPSEPRQRPKQYFGPINSRFGWRRLNVLFTRARERMVVFSSLRSGDVIPGGTSEDGAKGRGALKAFLHFAETGFLDGVPIENSGRDPESPFEIAVAEAVRGLGYECVPQLGVAGYFLDIAIKNPDDPDTYLLGVECDGAAYHSTRSARDRDRLRQEVLEGLGWTIHRIWSTEWFRNPSEEINRLAAELERQRELLRKVRSRSKVAEALVITPAEKAEPVEADKADRDEAPARASEWKLSAPEMPLRQAEFDLGTPTGRRVRPCEISVDDARERLIRLRENVIKVECPNVDPSTGLLRRTMLEALLKYRPVDLEEFQKFIPHELRTKTDGAQLRTYGDKVFEILEQVGD